MRNLLILLVIAGAVYHFFFRSPDTIDVLGVESEYQGGIETITNTNPRRFNVNDLAEPGQLTVVEFYTESCGACKKLRRHYDKFLKLRPDVAIKRVRMPDRWSVKWARRQFHLNIGATPFIHIYDTQGELIAADSGRGGDGRETLYEWMNDEMRRDWQQRHEG